jgi:hypothetical protein
MYVPHVLIVVLVAPISVKVQACLCAVSISETQRVVTLFFEVAVVMNKATEQGAFLLCDMFCRIQRVQSTCRRRMLSLKTELARCATCRRAFWRCFNPDDVYRKALGQIERSDP